MKHKSMKALKYSLVSGGLALLVSSCTSNLASPVSSATVSSSSSSSSAPSSRERVIAERVFNLVNSERSRAGKRAMRGHRGLNTLAQKHSNYMGASSQSANHFGSENRAQYAYLKYNIENLSEMTYAAPAGTRDPALAAVTAWKSSASHRKHMLQTWDLTGIGVRVAPGGPTLVTMCVGAQLTGVPRSVQPIGW
ncbi:MAG: CAP domain-containing protein [Verrucomicrobiae bacterium]|nr:CAP domain-containing protein [Verrucomicrobiae bacterium]NNJ43176.1 CAP domain-containing protein [Akkermansiaceae bacterium]